MKLKNDEVTERTELTIIYPEFDHGFEKRLDVFLRFEGWIWAASGYGFGERDLAYIRKSKINDNRRSNIEIEEGEEE